MSAEQQACADLKAVKEFRLELRKRPPGYMPEQKITATAQEVQATRERAVYVQRQHAVISSLSGTRLELAGPSDRFRVFFSPVGYEFVAVASEDGDDVLVSWANPRFLSIRDLSLGEKASLGKQKLRLESKTELDRESHGVLYDLMVRGVGLTESRFAEVRFDGDVPLALRTVEAVEVVALPDTEVLPPEPELLLRERARLGLDTVVRNKDGKVVEIPFALDERQWQAMARNAGSGTILLMGPPGTGKTTVALLRGTTLIHSIYEYDDHGKLLDDKPTADLKKDRFRVFVVTEHLRSYLKDFLASPEVGLPEVQAVNLRGSFLETFVRHKTLTTWISGVRFRLSKSRNKLSDALIFIKALPSTLRLCFFQAALNARENAGDDCETVIGRINDRLSTAFERVTLDRVLSQEEREQLRNEEVSSDFDLDVFLKRLNKYEAFDERFNQGYDLLRRGLPELRDFLRHWLAAVEGRAMLSVDAVDELWLLPGGDDLLLSRFVDELRSLHQQQGLLNLFIREAWRELVGLVDPQEVLLRVVGDFANTGDMKSLEDAGLTREQALSALREWQATLTGSSDSEADADEEEDDATVEEFSGEQEELELKRRRGAFTRTDFPLLASMARAFLALPAEAKANPERYQRVGFLLPDDLPRYDHVIIDEGQDFTYAEIHLVQSLVENDRMAVTISGDPLQRMDWRSGFSSIETIKVPEEQSFLITRNYRQTVELSEWVSRLSVALYGNDGHRIESTHERGPEPSVLVRPNLSEVLKVAAGTISEWFDDDQNPFTAVLLIGFDTRTKTRITNSLSNLLEEHSIHVERVEDGRMIERGRVSVADVPTVKGLEFDNVVVIVSKDACSSVGGASPQARVVNNHLYVACSRAKRGLEVILQDDVAAMRNHGLY